MGEPGGWELDVRGLEKEVERSELAVWDDWRLLGKSGEGEVREKGDASGASTSSELVVLVAVSRFRRGKPDVAPVTS